MTDGRQAWEIALRLWSQYNDDVVAGSRTEWALADELAGIIEDHLRVKADLLKVDVYSWRLKAVEVDPKPSWNIVAPYVESYDIESRLYIVEGDPTINKTWKRVPDDSIVLADMPHDPDDLKAVMLHAWEAGAQGLLVRSPVPRKIVVTGVWGYPWLAGAPSPIPVVVVDDEWARARRNGEKVRILVEANTRESVSRIVRVVEGDTDRVVVGAHYDKWESGFQDNVLGVAQAITTAGLLKEKGVDYELVLFPAEEHGAPGYAGWYWAWASRWYANEYRVAGLEDSVKLYINYDMAGAEPVKVSGAPQYTVHALNTLKSSSVNAVERPFECPECDSMSLALAGMPTLSLHTLWTERVREYYHTPLDTPAVASPVVAEAVVRAAVEAATAEPDYSAFTASVTGCLRSTGLAGRMIAYELEALARRHGWRRVFGWVNKSFLRPVHVGDYRLDREADITALYFPEACVPRLVSGEVHSVWIPGEETLLYHPRGGLRRQAFYKTQMLLERFREEARWALNR